MCHSFQVWFSVLVREGGNGSLTTSSSKRNAIKMHECRGLEANITSLISINHTPLENVINYVYLCQTVSFMLNESEIKRRMHGKSCGHSKNVGNSLARVFRYKKLFSWWTSFDSTSSMVFDERKLFEMFNQIKSFIQSIPKSSISFVWLQKSNYQLI